MKHQKIEIATVDRTDGKVLVEFTDSTVATYSAKELAELKPKRKIPRAMPIRRRKVGRLSECSSTPSLSGNSSTSL